MKHRWFVFFILTCSLSNQLWAETKSPDTSSSAVMLDVVVQDTILDLSLKAPLKLFLGFSRFPETAREKNLWKNFRTQWEDRSDKNITIAATSTDPKIHCEPIEATAEIGIAYEEFASAGQSKAVIDSEVVGFVQLNCDQSLAGKRLTLNFLKAVLRNHSATLTLMTSDGRQESLVLDAASTEFQL